jgi:hypothetical protein
MWGLLPDSAVVGVTKRALRTARRGAKAHQQGTFHYQQVRWEDTVEFTVEAAPDAD